MVRGWVGGCFWWWLREKGEQEKKRQTAAARRRRASFFLLSRLASLHSSLLPLSKLVSLQFESHALELDALSLPEGEREVK